MEEEADVKKYKAMHFPMYVVNRPKFDASCRPTGHTDTDLQLSSDTKSE